MMKNSTVLDALAGALLGAFITALACSIFLRPGIEIVAAHAVWSPCGFYNFIVTRADGTSEQYPDGPPSPEVMAEINALPPELRSLTVVPCPTMQVPQREAKSQNQARSYEARETARAGPNGPRTA